MEDQLPPLVYILMYKKDFYSAPRVMMASLNEDTIMDLAWAEAKRKFRYTGKPRNDYQYFDQSLRIEQVFLK